MASGETRGSSAMTSNYNRSAEIKRVCHDKHHFYPNNQSNGRNKATTRSLTQLPSDDSYILMVSRCLFQIDALAIGYADSDMSRCTVVDTLEHPSGPKAEEIHHVPRSLSGERSFAA